MARKNSIPAIVYCLAVFLLVPCFPLCVQGQVTNDLNTGYPENGIFHGSDIDNVQFKNGNLHASIPIWSAKGRGLGTGFNFVYDNHGWTFSTHCYTSGGGFCQDFVVPDRLSNMTPTIMGPFDYQFGGPSITPQQCGAPGSFIYLIGGFVLREPDGTKHHFAPDPIGENSNGQPLPPGSCGPPGFNTLYADDGSGWILHFDYVSLNVVNAISKSGTTILPGGGIGALAIIDANGNQLTATTPITQRGSGGTDTLGRTIPANGSYYDSSGTLQSLTITPSTGAPTQITLPNNQGTYTFTYAPQLTTQICQFSQADQCTENTGGGELTSITLPTGGEISYTWGPWDAGGRRVASRTVTANGLTAPWTYQYSPRPHLDSWVIVTDPAGKDMQCNTLSGLGCDTQQYFDGTANASPLIKTVQTDYQAVTIGTFDIFLPNRVTTTWNQQNLVSKVETDWDVAAVAGGSTSWRNPVEERQYDWGTGAPGPLLKRTHHSYRHLESDGQAYLNANIADLPTLVQTYDAAGNLMAQSNSTYDGSALTSTGTCTSGGAPGHSYCNYDASFLTRGNVTQSSHWLNTNNTWLNATHTYDDLGNVLSTTDPLNHTTNINYDDNWSDAACAGSVNTRAFPTLLTNALGQRAKTSYYTCTGLVQSVKDENDLAAGRGGTTHTYDLLNRPLVTSFPDGGQTSLSYNDTAPMTITKMVKATPDPDIVSTVQLDDLGRTGQTHLVDPEGDVYAETTYDAFGRKKTQTNPHRTLAAATDGTTQYAYDLFGRVTDVTMQDGSVIHTDYGVNVTTVTDEAGRKRRNQTDALGRLTTVFEDPTGLNYETDYQYDALGNLLRVDQKGSAPADSTQWRTRLFTYDSLSRLLTAANPESGTISYAYDADGNVITKTSPAPNQTGSATVTTTYTYDALSRLTLKSYSDSTPLVAFSYDDSSVWGYPLTNSIGRLTWEGTFPAWGQPYLEAAVFSYDAMGRAVNKWECIPSSCAPSSWSLYSLAATYDVGGDMTSYTTGVGVTFSQTFDSAGRVTHLTSNMADTQHPGTLATVDPNVGYYPTGGLRKLTFGNSLTETAAYNARLQPCRTNLNSSATVLTQCSDAVPGGNVQDFNYGYNAGSADNGNLASMSAAGTQGFNRTYGYDALNRLLTMSAAGDACSGLSWTYDSWANRTDQTVTGGACNSFHQAVGANNRLSGAGYQYDAAGNMTNDGGHAYTYDAENRIITVDGGNTASYVYDAVGRRVRKAAGTSWTDYVYDLAGNVVTEFQNTCGSACWATSYIYLGGALVAQYKNGTTYFVHKDHLGSTRLLTAAGPSTRIQSTGGTSLTKYFYDLGMSVNGATYTVAVWIKNQGTAPVQINSNVGWTGVTVAPGAWQNVNFNATGNGTQNIQFLINTLNTADPVDVLVYWPWVSQGSSGNLIPAANQNFSGWMTWQGASVTVTQGQAPRIVDSMDYLPYGEQIAGDTGTTHKFTGKERDSETNLDDFGARYFSSFMGRWLTPDWSARPTTVPYAQFGDPQSLNLYLFVRNDPVSVADADGHVGDDDNWWDWLMGLLRRKGSKDADTGDSKAEAPIIDSSSTDEVVTDATQKIGGGMEFVAETGATLDPTGVTSVAIDLQKGNTEGALLTAGVALLPGGTKAKAGVKVGERLLLEGTERKLLAEGTRTAELTQQGLDHIVLRHWPTSGAQNAGKFAPGTTGKSLKNMITETVANGSARPNSMGRPGQIVEHDFGRTIGTNSSGNLTTTMRVVIVLNAVKTAFPF